MDEYGRTQSKYSEDRKTGGRRTKRKCSKCKKMTRGIWNYQEKDYCYKCYREECSQTNGGTK